MKIHSKYDIVQKVNFKYNDVLLKISSKVDDDIFNIISNYDYFNKTDKEFSTTHIRKGMSINLPGCGGTLYGGLENNHGEEESGQDSENYSKGLILYYDKLCERIAKNGLGSTTYTDLMDLSVWKELENAYVNGNNGFREDYLIRALHKAGAKYCIISFAAEPVTDNAYDVNCSILVR